MEKINNTSAKKEKTIRVWWHFKIYWKYKETDENIIKNIKWLNKNINVINFHGHTHSLEVNFKKEINEIYNIFKKEKIRKNNKKIIENIDFFKENMEKIDYINSCIDFLKK